MNLRVAPSPVTRRNTLLTVHVGDRDYILVVQRWTIFAFLLETDHSLRPVGAFNLSIDKMAVQSMTYAGDTLIICAANQIMRGVYAASLAVLNENVTQSDAFSVRPVCVLHKRVTGSPEERVVNDVIYYDRYLFMLVNTYSTGEDPFHPKLWPRSSIVVHSFDIDRLSEKTVTSSQSSSQLLKVHLPFHTVHIALDTSSEGVRILALGQSLCGLDMDIFVSNIKACVADRITVSQAQSEIESSILRSDTKKHTSPTGTENASGPTFYDEKILFYDVNAADERHYLITSCCGLLLKVRKAAKDGLLKTVMLSNRGTHKGLLVSAVAHSPLLRDIVFLFTTDGHMTTISLDTHKAVKIFPEQASPSLTLFPTLHLNEGESLTSFTTLSPLAVLVVSDPSHADYLFYILRRTGDLSCYSLKLHKLIPVHTPSTFAWMKSVNSALADNTRLQTVTCAQLRQTANSAVQGTHFRLTPGVGEVSTPATSVCPADALSGGDQEDMDLVSRFERTIVQGGKTLRRLSINRNARQDNHMAAEVYMLPSALPDDQTVTEMPTTAALELSNDHASQVSSDSVIEETSYPLARTIPMVKSNSLCQNTGCFRDLFCYNFPFYIKLDLRVSKKQVRRVHILFIKVSTEIGMRSQIFIEQIGEIPYTTCAYVTEHYLITWHLCDENATDRHAKKYMRKGIASFLCIFNLTKQTLITVPAGSVREIIDFSAFYDTVAKRFTINILYREPRVMGRASNAINVFSILFSVASTILLGPQRVENQELISVATSQANNLYTLTNNLAINYVSVNFESSLYKQKTLFRIFRELRPYSFLKIMNYVIGTSNKYAAILICVKFKDPAPGTAPGGETVSRGGLTLYLMIVSLTDNRILAQYSLADSSPPINRYLYTEVPDVINRTLAAFEYPFLGVLPPSSSEHWPREDSIAKLICIIYIGNMLLAFSCLSGALLLSQTVTFVQPLPTDTFYIGITPGNKVCLMRINTADIYISPPIKYLS